MPPKIGPAPAQAGIQPRQAWPDRPALALREQARQDAIELARQVARTVRAEPAGVPLGERKALFASGFELEREPARELPPPEQSRLSEGSSSSLIITVGDSQPAPAAPAQVQHGSCLRAATRLLLGSVPMAAGAGLAAVGHATGDSRIQAAGFAVAGAGAAILASQLAQVCRAVTRHLGCASDPAPAT